MPSGGLPRTGRDEDGDADALLQQACLGYVDHLGGGKLPSPKVPTMRHAGAIKGITRQVPFHRTVKKGNERKRRWMADAELRDSTEMDFEAYGKPLETVSTFKYLGRVMTAGDDDWTEVAGNLLKVRKSWGRLSRILSREGADKKVSGTFSRRWCRPCCYLGQRHGYLHQG